MIVRCKGCGTTVSEWAARCSQCGTAVELSIAEAEPDPVVAGRPNVVSGVQISDGSPDPDSAMWSRHGASTFPVWERTGLAPAAPAAVVTESLPPVPPDADPTIAEQQVEQAEPPRRRRTWLWGAVAAAAALAVVALVVAVVLPSDEPAALAADRNAFEPIRHEPTEQWSVPASGELYSATLSDDTLYAGFLDDRGTPTEVAAYERDTGAKRWSKPLVGTNFGYVYLTANDEGVLISGGNDTTPSLQMLDAATGEELWHLDGSWYLLGRRLGDAFPAVKGGERPSTSEVYRIDSRTGVTERLPGQVVGYVSTGLMTEDDGTLVAFDAETLERRREWTLPDGELDGLEVAMEVGENLVGIRRGKVVGIDSEGGTWSLDVGGGDAGWLVPVAPDRVLAIVFDARTQASLIELNGEPSVLWSEQLEYVASVTPTVLLEQRDEQAVLMRITDAGLVEVGPIGAIEDVSQYGPTTEIVLVRDGNTLSGVRADGSTAWQAALTADQIFPVDGGVVATAEGDLILFI